ncbi:hypothetical protein GBA52_020775 [Prunus armeniaca]|nr:hypothetical protein GBA52_020775 [Prunus armeniaca]
MAKRCSALRKKKTNELSKLRRVFGPKRVSGKLLRIEKNWDLGIQDGLLGVQVRGFERKDWSCDEEDEDRGEFCGTGSRRSTTTL